VVTNPIELVPRVPEEQFSLPEAFGRLMGSAARPLRTLKERERYEGDLASRLAGATIHEESEDDGTERESDEDGDDQWDDDAGMWSRAASGKKGATASRIPASSKRNSVYETKSIYVSFGIAPELQCRVAGRL
jgi:hypothetical protein